MWYSIAIMRVYATALFWVCALAFYVLLLSRIEIKPIQKQATTEHANQGQATGEREQEIGSAPVGATGLSSKKESTDDKKHADEETWDWHNAFTPPIWSNWALVLVGIGATAAALFTLGAIKHQTAHLRNSVIQSRKGANAAKKSAIAASKSTEALVNIERAWLIPATEFVKPNELPTIGIVNSQVETIIIRIENCGHTPAWLMDWSINVIVLNDTNIEQATGVEQPDGDFPNARPFPQGRTEEFPFEWKTNGAEIAAINSGQKHLYIYGFLQYRSIIGDEPRISWFCFHYFHKRNSVGGFDNGWAMEPPEENHYT